MVTRMKDSGGAPRHSTTRRKRKKKDEGISLYKDPTNRNPLQLVNDFAKGPEWNKRQERARKAKAKAGAAKAKAKAGKMGSVNKSQLAGKKKPIKPTRGSTAYNTGLKPKPKGTIKYPQGKTPNVKPKSKGSVLDTKGYKKSKKLRNSGGTAKPVAKPKPTTKPKAGGKLKREKPKTAPKVPKALRGTKGGTRPLRAVPKKSTVNSPSRLKRAAKYKGQSSKKAVASTMKRVTARSGKTGKSATRQARRIVRDRKARRR